MSTTISNIISKAGYNLRGVLDCLFVPTSMIVSIPDRDPVTNVVDVAEIQLTNGDESERGSWHYFKFTHGTAVWSEELTEVNGETVFNQSLKGFVAKQNITRWAPFEAMERQEFVLVIRDFNGFSTLVGGMNADDEVFGLRFKWRYATGRVNGYEVEFYGALQKKAAAAKNIVTTEVIASPPPPPNPDSGPVSVPVEEES